MSRRTLFIAAAVAVVVLLGLVFVRNQTDFAVYYAAGRSLLSGRTDLYSPDFARGVVMDYRYPPFFILVFAPLSLAPYWLAAYVWHLVNTLAIVVTVASIASLYTAEPYSRGKVWTVAFLAVVPYYAMALDYGNAHLMATALMCAAFRLAITRRDVPAATLLALAMTVKIIPALTLPWFAIKGRLKLLGLVFAITAALNLFPSVYFGIAGNWDLVQRWYQHAILRQEFHETNGPINVSLKGQLRRTFTEVDYTRRVDGDDNYAAVNVARVPAPTVDRVWLALSACSVLGGLVLIWWSSRRDKSGHEGVNGSAVRIEALQLGLMICLMLFVGPLTSKVYLVALLWPVMAVAIDAWDHAPVRRVLVAAAILSSALPLLPGRTVQRWLLVAGVDFYLICVVLGLVAYSLYRRRWGAGSFVSPIPKS